MAETDDFVPEGNELVNQAEDGDGSAEVAPAEQQQQQPRMGTWSVVKTLVIRCLFIYFISSFFRRSSTPATDTSGGPQPPAMTATNVYQKNMLMDMYVFISENENFTSFNDGSSLVWLEEDLVYGDWTSGFHADGSYDKLVQVPLSETVMNNGSLYIHVYFVKAGQSPNPIDKNYNRRFCSHNTKLLTRYKKRKFHTTVNLLSGKTDVHPDLIKKDNVSYEILSFFHPNLTINLIEDYTPWQHGMLPAPLDTNIKFLKNEAYYYPIVFLNDYWNLHSDYMPVNETTPVLNFTLTYSPMSLFKWQLYAAQGMRNQWFSMFGDEAVGESDEEQDSLKTTLVETNPYLLALTIIVSIVHSVFEFLAFKNDIQFWKNKKSLEGLSVRSVFFGVFQSVVVVLYVLDNETNFVVRVSVIIGLAIEIWKITKVVNIKLDRERMILGAIPRVVFEDKSTYTESNTKQYDQMAFKYLSWLLFPLLGCYAVYSVLYNEHKGWYSYVLNMLYGFLLTFGFIVMTPQLFINYKLKSVAHLPWRMMTYKALNTFIDDLFAFVIKMPTLYRIGCFRDDIIFLIALYQRYIYPVDKSRVNEFGTTGEMHEAVGNGDMKTVTGEGEGDVADEQEEKTEAEKKKD